MMSEIEDKIRRVKKSLRSINYVVGDVSAKELVDYMCGETFSSDKTTLGDVLGNEYLLVHEVVEIGELKKMGRRIDRHVIVDSPKIIIYSAHLTALEVELSYALYKKDLDWIRMRLEQFRESVLEDDPFLPRELRPRAIRLFRKFCSIVNLCK